MSSDEIEIPLSGGNTSGEVVRVGNTVRKSMKDSSESVHRLLQFLETEGFPATPRFLGIDDQGREILSYLEGSCKIASDAWESQSILKTTAKLLKAFHDTTAQYPISDVDSWAKIYPDRSKHDVICHNDFGLYNLIINNDACTGIIDFDLAGPGPRLRDVAYAAYWLVPLSMHGDNMKPHSIADFENGSARLKLFCNTYGIAFDMALLDMVSEILLHMSDYQEMINTLGDETAKTLLAAGHLDHWSMEAVAFNMHRTDFEKNIT